MLNQKDIYLSKPLAMQ